MIIEVPLEGVGGSVDVSSIDRPRTFHFEAPQNNSVLVEVSYDQTLWVPLFQLTGSEQPKTSEDGFDFVRAVRVRGEETVMLSIGPGGAQGPSGPAGPAGPTGATGATGPAGGVQLLGGASASSNVNVVRWLYPGFSYSSVLPTRLFAPAPVCTVNRIALTISNGGTGTGSLRYELEKNGVATGLFVEANVTVPGGIYLGTVGAPVSFGIGDTYGWTVIANGSVSVPHQIPILAAFLEVP